MSDIIVERLEGMGARARRERIERMRACDGARVLPVRSLDREPGALWVVVELGDGVTGFLDPEPAAPRRRYAQRSEFRSGEVGESTVLQSVLLDVPDPQQLSAWYVEEHMPLLFRVPGWLRCWRGERVDGDGPRYLALHELADESVATDPRGDEARSTAWRDRVMATVTSSERDLFAIDPIP